MSDIAELTIKQRIQRLEAHLEQENPILLEIVKSFEVLDGVAYRLGLLESHQSFATRVPWWPLISVLGTFSSGKSTFINHFLGFKLQLTGNQAVDDKFTVVCFSSDETPRTLPGLALDADPRFPFFRISQDIEEVATGEGRRVDAYLQLKTCPSEALRGKILIDSPGFDADAQRTSTLRITDHIIDLSDLVLVFFDARHPEPGAMQDTLKHLVTDTIKRPDSNKFLYILNQIDATAREDNPEEVFAAWQRALAQAGLTAGRFYRTYNPEAAIPIEDENLRQRFESKRAVDMAEIHGRMQQVEVERAYRVIGVLEKTAKTIENELVHHIQAAKETWKRRVLWADGIVFGLIAVGLFAGSLWAGNNGEAGQQHFAIPQWLDWLTSGWIQGGLALAVLVVIATYVHFTLRKLGVRSVVATLKRDRNLEDVRDLLIPAFLKNTRVRHSILNTKPVGWGRRAQKKIAQVLSDADRYVENLNDRFTNPSGVKANCASPTAAGSAQMIGGSVPKATAAQANTVKSEEKSETVAVGR